MISPTIWEYGIGLAFVICLRLRSPLAQFVSIIRKFCFALLIYNYSFNFLLINSYLIKFEVSGVSFLWPLPLQCSQTRVYTAFELNWSLSCHNTCYTSFIFFLNKHWVCLIDHWQGCHQKKMAMNSSVSRSTPLRIETIYNSTVFQHIWHFLDNYMNLLPLSKNIPLKGVLDEQNMKL